MKMSRRERLALAALYPVIAIEIAFFVIALISFFAKRDILTEHLAWRGSLIWIPLGLFFICILLLIAIQGWFISNGRRPPLFRKSEWKLSPNQARRRWLVYSWNSLIGFAAMIILDFSATMGRWGIIPILIAMLMIIFSIVLRRKMTKDEPKRRDLTNG